MLYLDTALVVAALTSEAATDRVQQWMSSTGDEPLAISGWVTTEFSAALATKVRMGGLDRTERDAAKAAYADLVSRSLVRLDIDPAHFDQAARLADQDAGLRGGDALHLAVAVEADATLCTLDRRFVQACSALGLAALLI